MHDGRVFGLAGAGRHDAGITQRTRRLPAVERLGERAALVRLEQHRVRGAGRGGLSQQRRAGHQKIVADHLHACADCARKPGETLRVVFGQRVFDAGDGEAVAPTQQQFDQAVAVELAALQAEPIAAAVAEVAGRHVERDRHLRPRHEAGLPDRLDQGVERLLVGVERRPPAAFVGHAAQRAAPRHQQAGVAVDLGGPFQRLREAVGAGADDHEVLDVDTPAGVCAATEDLDLRHRHQHGVGPAEVSVQRQPVRRCRRVCAGHRHGECRVGAQTRLVRRAVQRDQAGIERGLVVGCHAAHGGGDLAVDMRHRTEHVEPAVARAAVAPFERLARAFAGAGRHDGTAARTVAQRDLGLDRRPAPAVPDAARVHLADFAVVRHAASSCCQASLTAASVGTGCSSSRLATRRTLSRCASVSM